MKKAGNVRKSFVSLPALFFFMRAVPLFAGAPTALVPSVAPGIYASPQIVSFEKPDNCRLLVGIDGSAPAEISGPVLLSAPEGSSREIRVEAILYPFEPASEPSVHEFFSWTIDREPPGIPSFDAKKRDDGSDISVGLSEPGDVLWRMYHPWYKASASGRLAPGETIFVPDGATLCAYGIDRAGNRGPAAAPAPDFSFDRKFPCRLISPVPGTWANTQMLVIERGSGVKVTYTTDGSDPSGGTVYSAPVLLSDASITNVRIQAINAAGEKFEEQVRFSVVPSASVPPQTSPVPALPADGSLVETGEFMEIRMNEGFTCSPGNVVLPDSASRQLVLTSVRGVRTFFPVTVTDGKSIWRWMCAGGPAGNETEKPAARPETGNGPDVKIHDWYFVEIRYRDPVYCSVDSNAWQPVSGPVFVERSEEHVLYWYSGTWKSGEIQKIALPAKPSLTGIPAGGLTANPVFIASTDTPCTLRYEGGLFSPVAPSPSSPELASGLLVEVPKGTESVFSFRVIASYGGLEQGELGASFTIDRKNPRTPDAGIPENVEYSRAPVVLRPSGEDLLQVSITPDLFSEVNHTYILEGDPARPVIYTVTMFAVDRAGNKSPVLARKLTVDLNALYVDAAGQFPGKRDGTPYAPYISLDDALDAVHGSGDWRIYIAGDAVLSAPHIVRNGIAITSTGGSISAGENAVLDVSRASLSIRGCSVIRAKPAVGQGAGFAGSEAPFIRLDNASLELDGCTIGASASASGTLFRARNSSVRMRDTGLSFSASEYARIIDAENSDLFITGCRLAVSAQNASAIGLSASQAVFEDSTVTVSSVSACRAVEAWASTLSMKDLSLVRSAPDASKRPAENRDTAVWLDAKSRILSEIAVTADGFWRLHGTGSKR